MKVSLLRYNAENNSCFRCFMQRHYLNKEEDIMKYYILSGSMKPGKIPQGPEFKKILAGIPGHTVQYIPDSGLCERVDSLRRQIQCNGAVD